MPTTKKRPLRILGIACSTVNEDDEHVRTPTSDKLLVRALEHAKKDHGCDTRIIKLRDLTFRHCEANYSIKSEYCVWPCWIQQRFPDDGMGIVYESLVEWCDAVIIATPIRWGNAASLYYKMAERLNCLENHNDLQDEDLIGEKSAAFIIGGGQDNVQHVAGELFSFWSQQGFLFGKRAFVGWTAGGYYNEDMSKTPAALKTAIKGLDEDIVTMVDGLVRAKRALNALPGGIKAAPRPKADPKVAIKQAAKDMKAGKKHSV